MTYDVIVIGGGVAGLSAALFTAKAGLNTIVLDKGNSQITRVSKVQNIPGFPEGISGIEWIANTKKQVSKFDGKIINTVVTEAFMDEDELYQVKTEEETYRGKYLIIATNANEGILSSFGFELSGNSKIPNNKAKAVSLSSFNGETSVKNLYLAGLITELPSQVSVALGHGAAVGIAIASKENEKPFMWHDL